MAVITSNWHGSGSSGAMTIVVAKVPVVVGW